ncbi:MAG: T9SS type A sorting domain-containing protein [Cyclobacteriaceae bacterium]|nr:T9SS type A sorting domain-containing protein [Cyclobacteriaceae bacterium]
MHLKKLILAVFAISGITASSYAQVIQSSGLGSGNWNDPLSWLPNTVPTNSNSSSIVILPGHTINVNANFTVDQLIINGTLNVNAGTVFTIANGSGVDITLTTGTLTVAGTLVGNDGYTSLGFTALNTSFSSGSTYRHLYGATEGSVPVASWNANSTLEIAGFTSTVNATNAGNWSQNFGNVIYNCPQGPNTVVSFEGLLTSVQGNFTALSTGTNTNNRMNLSSSQNATVTIGGNFLISGTARVYLSISATNFVFNVGGNFTVSSAYTPACYLTLTGTTTADVTGGFTVAAGNTLGFTNSSTAVADVNLTGDFTLAGTASIKSGSHGFINFTGATTKNYVNTGAISGPLGMNILANATVNFGTNIFSGTGNFIVSGTIQLGALDPAGAYQSGAAGGNIRNTGSRTFNSGSVLAYNGVGAQTIGLHPSVAGLTIANASGVSLTGSLTISGDMTFQSGTLVLGAFSLTLSGNVNTVSGNVQSTAASGLLITGAGTFNSIAFSSSPATIGTLNLNRSGIVVALSTDLTVATALTLSSNSVLNISGRSLTISGSYSASSAARIASSATSNLAVNGVGAIAVFRFRTGNSNLNNWTIDKPSSTVTLGTSLNLFGTLTIQSTGTTFAAGSGLSLQSSNDNPSVDATIATIPTGSAVTGSITVNRYMSAEGDLNRYISSPISNASVASLQDDFPVTGTAGSFVGQSNPCTGCSAAFSLKYYDEAATGVWTNTYRRYPLSTNTETLQVGRGYVAYMWNGENQITWDVTGPINQGTIALPVTRTLSSPALPNDDGWNLVGNPYPSTIRWDDAVGWTMSNIAPIVYVPDNGAGGVFRSWNPVDNTGDLTGGLIATGQAFWVFASGASPSLSIHETAKVASGSGAFYRERSASEHLVVSLEKQGLNVKDNSFLLLNSDATDGFDQLYEVPKLQNESFDVGLKDVSSNRLGRLAMREMSSDAVIPLSVRVSEAGDYTLSFTPKNNFRYSESLKLLDKLTGAVTSMTETYSFKTGAEGKIDNRFVLTFNSERASLENTVSVYPNPAIDRIEVTTQEPAHVVLMSAVGQMLEDSHTRETEGVNRYTFEMQRFNKGIYYIQVRVGAQSVTRKIIKQ